MQANFRLQGAFALMLLTYLAGCSGSRGRPNKAEEASSLKPIAMYYGEYVKQHRGQPPARGAEFKGFLEGPQVDDRLQAEFEITDIDKMLVSPRDNKPYFIYYGAMSKNSGPGGAPVVGYEQIGAEGKRFVASGLPAVAEVDEAAFRKMIPDAK